MIEIDVLRVALSKEEDAIETYRKMLADFPSLKELLFLLITEEQKHKVLIEKKIKELTKY
jgi:rubrerythrin